VRESILAADERVMVNYLEKSVRKKVIGNNITGTLRVWERLIFPFENGGPEIGVRDWYGRYFGRHNDVFCVTPESFFGFRL
jgi:hypothetical protein